APGSRSTAGPDAKAFDGEAHVGAVRRAVARIGPADGRPTGQAEVGGASGGAGAAAIVVSIGPRPSSPGSAVSRSRVRSVGTRNAVAPTTARVRRPPPTTLGTVPKIRAAKPLSNAPSSFDAPMNTQFTDATRPRMRSGERTRRIVWRITMLT